MVVEKHVDRKFLFYGLESNFSLSINVLETSSGLEKGGMMRKERFSQGLSPFSWLNMYSIFSRHRSSWDGESLEGRNPRSVGGPSTEISALFRWIFFDLE